jgi:putative transposase
MRAEGNEVSMARLCRWFGVPRSTVYYRSTPAGRVVFPSFPYTSSG